MCGCLIMFQTEGKKLPAMSQNLAQGLQSMRHRGPDGQHVWLHPNGHVGLAHARLSIIDLEGGDQPLRTPDGLLSVVVNGELYDFEKIRAQLTALGHVFQTKSDSEIVLYLYRQYGLDFFQHLRGEFAIALWDESKQTLLLARDRFGIKPLFYSIRDGVLLAGSEIKALLGTGLIPAKWSANAVNQAIHAGLPLGQATLFDGVYQVPPGTFIEIRMGQSHQPGTALAPKSYWDFNYPQASAAPSGPVSPQQERDYIAQFRQLFTESVGLRLRADVPVAAYLSGGIDSSAVFGAANQLLQKPIDAFTISFDEAEYDETRIAADTAAKYGANFSPLFVNEQALADNLGAAVWHAETLLKNSHGVAKYLLSGHVQKAGIKVVLTGEGADEILAGYPPFREDLMLDPASGLSQAQMEEGVRALYQNNQASMGLFSTDDSQSSPFLQQFITRFGFVPSWLKTQHLGGLKAKGLYHAPLVREWESTSTHVLKEFFDCTASPKQLDGVSRLHQSMYLWSKTALPNYILNVLGDRMEMAHSVEARLSFLDHHLVEAVAAMPISMKIRDGIEKYVLREASKDLLSETIYRKQKQPFLAPPIRPVSKSPLVALVKDLVWSKSFENQPFFDPQQIKNVLENIDHMPTSARSSLDVLLMRVASVAVMQKKFFE